MHVVTSPYRGRINLRIGCGAECVRTYLQCTGIIIVNDLLFNVIVIGFCVDNLYSIPTEQLLNRCRTASLNMFKVQSRQASSQFKLEALTMLTLFKDSGKIWTLLWQLLTYISLFAKQHHSVGGEGQGEDGGGSGSGPRRRIRIVISELKFIRPCLRAITLIMVHCVLIARTGLRPPLRRPASLRGRGPLALISITHSEVYSIVTSF